MASYIIDIEANGLLPEVTTIHCLVAMDIDTGEMFSYGPTQIEEAIELLRGASLVVGHNGLDYDFRVLDRLHGYMPAVSLDTLVLARLIFSNKKMEDFDERKLPAKLCGSHSLKAWGLRLDCHKGDFEGPWDTWTPEMQSYCEQDVRTTWQLWKRLKVHEYSKVAIELEHQMARICLAMEEQGWHFDTKAAQELYVKLATRRDEIEKQLVETYGSWQEVDKIITPKRDNKKLGYTAGVPVTKYKTVVFNPGSRVHIEKKLREAGWKPQAFTDSGRAKLDEEILLRIDLPEAKLLVEYLLVQKRLGQLGDGENGWLRVVGVDQRLHPRYNPNGTVTGRATHYNPNISQVPAVRAPYGRECRALLRVPKGWKLVGADMAGLELRCLAHYLAHFDKGEYAKVVTEGDVHSFNQEAAGLPTRDMAKTFCYGWLYGAGDEKIGKIVGGTAKQGKILKERFMQRIPAIKSLKRLVSQAAAKGYLKALDGRQIPIRSDHSALNMLLQSAGAILCKTWLVNAFDELNHTYRHGYDGDFVYCGWLHDECQAACKEELADAVGAILVKHARKAGDVFNFKCPLDSNYVIGNNWAETH